MSTAARALLLLAAFGGQGVLADPLRPWWNWSWEVLPRWASGQGATGFTNTTVAHYTDIAVVGVLDCLKEDENMKKAAVRCRMKQRIRRIDFMIEYELK